MRRDHVKMAIEYNPISISIEWVELIREGGGRKEVPRKIGPLKCRKYLARAPGLNKSTDVQGSRKSQHDFNLLVPHDADLPLTIKDDLTVPLHGMSFKFLTITPQYQSDELICYHCELERVI
ncbi:hypothetical protein DH09_08230 [Bacillaceae bacterium JMAK1]|nr:hypothetical protein DH09_08230 [Bacillaceae bacterium JMAK1]